MSRAELTRQLVELQRQYAKTKGTEIKDQLSKQIYELNCKIHAQARQAEGGGVHAHTLAAKPKPGSATNSEKIR